MRRQRIPLLAALLLTQVSPGATEFDHQWTVLPVPKDATQVRSRLLDPKAPPDQQCLVTKFRLRRRHPDALFLTELDKALGSEWKYCGGWPEVWHVSEAEPGVSFAAGNWCSPTRNRTISVVLEFPGRRAPDYSRRGKPDYSRRDKYTQDVSVWEEDHFGPCRYQESGGLNCETPRPGG